MTPDDKAKFAETLRATMSLYDREVAPAAMLIWWGALKEYPLDDVGTALASHIKGKGGHFAPLPADVIAYCKKNTGHLSGDEAWALALTSLDEDESVIWTTQIAEAMGAARPCLDNGDKYGARLAFLSAYERTSQSGAPAWTVSLGNSHEGRERAIDQMLRRGLMAPSHAVHLLPYYCQLVASVSGLLPAPEKTPEEKANALRVLAELKEKFLDHAETVSVQSKAPVYNDTEYAKAVADQELQNEGSV